MGFGIPGLDIALGVAGAVGGAAGKAKGGSAQTQSLPSNYLKGYDDLLKRFQEQSLDRPYNAPIMRRAGGKYDPAIFGDIQGMIDQALSAAPQEEAAPTAEAAPQAMNNPTVAMNNGQIRGAMADLYSQVWKNGSAPAKEDVAFMNDRGGDPRIQQLLSSWFPKYGMAAAPQQAAPLSIEALAAQAGGR